MLYKSDAAELISNMAKPELHGVRVSQSSEKSDLPYFCLKIFHTLSKSYIERNSQHFSVASRYTGEQYLTICTHTCILHGLFLTSY